MRKREAIQPRKSERAEVDTVLNVADSNVQTIARVCIGSAGVNRAWRACKDSICIPGRSGRLRKVRGIEVLQMERP